MNTKIQIKPPVWPRELTFQEFKKLNPQINENQLIHLYNQYLGKFLEELRQQKTHFKQSLNKQLVVELESFSKNLQSSTIDSTAGAGGLNYKSRGIGSMAVGVYLDVNLQHSSLPVDEGYPRFTVRDPNAPKYFTYGGQATPPHY